MEVREGQKNLNLKTFSLLAAVNYQNVLKIFPFHVLKLSF